MVDGHPSLRVYIPSPWPPPAQAADLPSFPRRSSGPDFLGFASGPTAIIVAKGMEDADWPAGDGLWIPLRSQGRGQGTEGGGSPKGKSRSSHEKQGECAG